MQSESHHSVDVGDDNDGEIAPPTRSLAQLINKAMAFTEGQFAGMCIRTDLVEVQGAALGRKFARIDRRTLDPPPVVLIRLFQVLEDQTEIEIENYHDINNQGLTCTVDLFPVSKSAYDQSQIDLDAADELSDEIDNTRTLYTTQALPNGIAPMKKCLQLPLFRNQTDAVPVRCDFRPGVVALLKSFPITTSSKCTEALIGTTFVQSQCVDYKGVSCLLFTFSDLAVNLEGTFCLRYRVFDLFSRVAEAGHESVIQAECLGVPFQIYSTKDFPGLPKSTPLTKHLSNWGIRVNLRAVDRKYGQDDPRDD